MPKSSLNMGMGSQKAPPPPRNHCKYLGVHFSASPARTQLQDLLLSEMLTFFHNLSLLPLTLSEGVKLTNLQLIPILTHRLLAHISEV